MNFKFLTPLRVLSSILLWPFLADAAYPQAPIIVAVIDTGVEIEHPELQQNIWSNQAEALGIEGVDDDGNGYIDDLHGYNFIDETGKITDLGPHGTHVAGIIAAKKFGVNPNAQIMPLAFMNTKGGTPHHAARAIRYAVDHGARIINCSWGEETKSQELEEAIAYALFREVVIVASAGNLGINNDFYFHYPSHHAGVITVANLDGNDHLDYFSNYGARTVDIGAPGVDILSTWVNGSYELKSGTSMAAPYVSGALSLLLGQEPWLTVSEVKERLYRTGIYREEYRGKLSSAKKIDLENLLRNSDVSADLPGENWQRFDLETAIATDHPYRPKKWWSHSVTIPGAKFIRAHYRKIDFGLSSDAILLSGSDRKVYDKATGVTENFYSSFVVGEKISFQFLGESEVGQWGIEIDYLEYQ